MLINSHPLHKIYYLLFRKCIKYIVNRGDFDTYYNIAPKRKFKIRENDYDFYKIYIIDDENKIGFSIRVNMGTNLYDIEYFDFQDDVEIVLLNVPYKPIHLKILHSLIRDINNYIVIQTAQQNIKIGL